MTSFFHTDPFPSMDPIHPDLSILHELELEYNNPQIGKINDEYLPTEEDVYSSPLSDDPSLQFTINTPYDQTLCIKSESTYTQQTYIQPTQQQQQTTHHIPILPFQSITATRTAKKRRRFAGMENLRGVVSEDEQQDDASINSADSHSYSSSTSSSPTQEVPKKGRKSTKKNKNHDMDEPLDKRSRNKVSASKYRKRRKIYLDTLEEKTNELEQKYVHVTEQVSVLDTENRILKEQLLFLKNLLHTKGTDMNDLEQQLNTTNANTSGATVTQQQGSIFMFVLFSCFLLFNPMTWFTSTTSNNNNNNNLSSSPIRYDTSSSSLRHVGRTLKEFSLEDTNTLEFANDLSFNTLGDTDAYLNFVGVEMDSETATAPTSVLSTPSSASSSSSLSSSSSAPESVSRVVRAAPRATYQAIAPKSIPTITSDSYTPLTGAPQDLKLKSLHSDVDIDDAIQTYHVQQPVDVEADQYTDADEQDHNSTDTVTETHNVPVPSASSVDITAMHKTVHDHAFLPLVRLIGEEQAMEALQSLAQGVMNVHLSNKTTDASQQQSQQQQQVY